MKLLQEVNERQHQELLSYLDSLRPEAKQAGESSEVVLELAYQFWGKLRNFFLSRGFYLEVPDACPGSRSKFMFAWSTGEHYLECEIFASSEIEFFYRNIKTHEVWEEDATLEQEFSPAFINKIELFVETKVSGSNI